MKTANLFLRYFLNSDTTSLGLADSALGAVVVAWGATFPVYHWANMGRKDSSAIEFSKIKIGSNRREELE